MQLATVGTLSFHNDGDSHNTLNFLAAPNPPTLVVTPVYDSSGSLLEIKSQASEGVGGYG